MEKCYVKPQKEFLASHRKGYEYIPESNNFKRNMGLWTLHFWKGETIESKNLNDFISVPGVEITNSLHHYGYKYNHLYNSWRVYNFMTERYI